MLNRILFEADPGFFLLFLHYLLGPTFLSIFDLGLLHQFLFFRGLADLLDLLFIEDKLFELISLELVQ